MLDQNALNDLPVPHEDGSWINANVSRIAELIRDFDPNIDVRWIPPNRRGHNDPGFALVTRDVSGLEYVVLYVQDEAQFDGSVLEKLYKLKNTTLSDIDAANIAAKAVQQKRNKEQLEEKKDLAYHILKSKRHEYKHQGTTYT